MVLFSAHVYKASMEGNTSLRLFVSVEIPEGIRRKIAALAKELPHDAITPVRPENMHLTLRFIGEVPAEQLAEIGERLRAVEFAPFSLSLKGVGVFPSEDYIRVVWVGCENEQLSNLAEKIEKALAGIGTLSAAKKAADVRLAPFGSKREKEERGFSAHLTIARVKRKIDVKKFLLSHVDEEFGTCDVRSFNLMQSELEMGKAPRYIVVEEFGAKS